jgi:uncharacterized protein YciI
VKQFVFHGVDRPDSINLRTATLPAHAHYQHHRGNPVGGPLLDAAGASCGTLIIFEAPDLAAAQAIIADDPFVTAGLFASTSVYEFRAVDWPA